MAHCTRILILRIATLLGTPLLFAQGWESPVREIPVPALQDIAMTSFDQFGPVISYNPVLVEQAGPALAAFFRAHEYGHVELNHIQREFFQANAYNRAWIRKDYEREADCYAARILRESFPEAIPAAIGFFNARGATAGDWYHPTGYDRAEVVRACDGTGSPTTILVPCVHPLTPWAIAPTAFI
jgi:hypothetical protein